MDNIIPELLEKILQLVPDGGTYKSVRRVCKRWRVAAGDRIDEFSNHLWTLIDMYPNMVEWNWEIILVNPNTTWNLIQRVPEWDRNWRYISQNPNITWEFIRDNPQYPWVITIFKNPNLTFEHIKQVTDWDWRYFMDVVSANPNITLQDIEENSDVSWDWLRLCRNKNIPLEYLWEKIKNSPDKRYITGHPNMTIDFINSHIEQYGHFYCGPLLSEHPNITLDIIKANPHICWSKCHIWGNPNVTCEYLLNLDNEYHSFNNMIDNPNFTWRILSKCIKYNLNAGILCRNKFQYGMTMKYPDRQLEESI